MEALQHCATPVGSQGSSWNCNIGLPTGNLTELWKITHVHGKIQCTWPFSVAMLVITRGYQLGLNSCCRPVFVAQETHRGNITVLCDDGKAGPDTIDFITGARHFHNPSWISDSCAFASFGRTSLPDLTAEARMIEGFCGDLAKCF